MRQPAMIALLGLFAVHAAGASGAEPSGRDSTADRELKTLFQFRVDDPVAYHARIQTVRPDGSVAISDGRGIRRGPREPVGALTEGYYLGLTGLRLDRSFQDSRLVRVQVREVQEGGKALLQVGRDAVDEIRAGHVILLMRPAGSPTKQMAQVPAVAPLVDTTGQTPGLELELAAVLESSKNNLKQIGLALHNYHDVHGHFPPAVVYGPDGKPWHSWRVLLLPYLDGAHIFARYRLDEPWDGPNNRKLLSRMPKVYRDPVYGDSDDYYTHYAAVTGKGTLFPTEGLKTDGRGRDIFGRGPGVKGFRDVTDGSANTIIVGSVSPDRKIPWMKPEDVVVDDKFLGIGRKGGFAAPYKSEQGAAGVFLRCEGSVTAILSEIETDELRKALLIADGELAEEVPTIDPPRARYRVPRGKEAAHVIRIVETKKGPEARLAIEFVDAKPERPYRFKDDSPKVPEKRPAPENGKKAVP